MGEEKGGVNLLVMTVTDKSILFPENAVPNPDFITTAPLDSVVDGHLLAPSSLI